MDRRSFAKSAATLTTGTILSTSKVSRNRGTSTPFNLNYAPHLGMFKHSAGNNILDQLRYIADQGFTAFEDNEMRNRPIKEQQDIAKVMQEHNLNMGVFVAHKIYWQEPNLTSGKQGYRDEFLSDIKKSVDVAKRVHAKWMTVVPGHVALNLRPGYQMANVVETLNQACEILEPHNLVMVLEPLNFDGHAGQYLQTIDQAYIICKAVDSPSCKILYDVYHQQITEGHIIPNIDLAWDEIAYFQVGDNPGRKEPTTGEINYKNVFQHIYNKGYNGIIGMEHGNSKPGRVGEDVVIQAYKSVDNFTT